MRLQKANHTKYNFPGTEKIEVLKYFCISSLTIKLVFKISIPKIKVNRYEINNIFFEIFFVNIKTKCSIDTEINVTPTSVMRHRKLPNL